MHAKINVKLAVSGFLYVKRKQKYAYKYPVTTIDTRGAANKWVGGGDGASVILDDDSIV